MLLGWRTAELLLLLLLLLLPAASLAESGERSADLVSESRISCVSHISTKEISLTCKLVGSGNEDDEDEDDEDEDEAVEAMTACFKNPVQDRLKCPHVRGDSITFTDLTPLTRLNLTIHLRRGGTLTKTVQLSKIVKPRSPEVWNVTVNQDSNQAVFHIRTPYLNDYLKVENQLFQLVIWTTDTKMIENVSSSDTMTINMEHLLKNRDYHVKVRAIPVVFLKGSWSEWSDPLDFFIPDVRVGNHKSEELVRSLMACFVPLGVLAIFSVFFWKKIFPYIWPKILHPKPILVQNCKANKTSLLLNLKPEEFSALKIYPAVEKDEQEPVKGLRNGNDPCSTQSSDCSADTEVLELSILLSSSCSEGNNSLQSSDSLLVETPDATHGSGVNLKEEDYVTMSSFYQIK
ncbi:interleukin-7 receptor subunit alpha isoform X2 [Nerophis ophidion]|uniref:interleukin-7 receptor subunit alpha isoform X2 n=1 Tax=Nerophis ophidion TaxID=159077 RepID=UPI002ADFA2BE|nr:interleukin-7 receptor subunit alpha isoform X2 [Nerophis ophidion]